MLDALRGFAIFGIFMINARVFSGYAYMTQEEKGELMLADWNDTFDIIHTVFFLGKFYTLFALMFGIGFAIQFIRATSTDRSFTRHFSRRLFFLLLIGLVHLWGIWFSDILVLYALCGYALILFQRLPDRGLIVASFLLLCLPGLYNWYLHTNEYGFTLDVYEYLSESWVALGLPQTPNPPETFQMRDVVEVIQSDSWATVLTFNFLGPLLRGYIYLLNARFLIVLAFFVLGFWAGRQLMLHKQHKNKARLIRIAVTGFLLGVPLNLLLIVNNPTGLDYTTAQTLKALLEPFGYLSLTAAYMAGFMLLFLSPLSGMLTRLLSPVGKTALTNYILQSFIGIFLFYEIGLGMGAYLGSAHLTLMVFLVFGFQILISHMWLRYFRYGPLEWLWRVLTYGRYMPLQRNK